MVMPVSVWGLIALLSKNDALALNTTIYGFHLVFAWELSYAAHHSVHSEMNFNAVIMHPE